MNRNFSQPARAGVRTAARILFNVAPNSQAVIYRADAEEENKAELYVAFTGWRSFVPVVVK
ncbi:MAG TPA: hypothetical protein VMC62_08295 [Longilinea sp.]|nr:hypothetical protein [Longilinea sp.]